MNCCIFADVKVAAVFEQRDGSFYLVVLKKSSVEGYVSTNLRLWGKDKTIEEGGVKDALIYEVLSKKRFYILTFNGKDMSIHSFTKTPHIHLIKTHLSLIKFHHNRQTCLVDVAFVKKEQREQLFLVQCYDGHVRFITFNIASDWSLQPSGEVESITIKDTSFSYLRIVKVHYENYICLISHSSSRFYLYKASFKEYKELKIHWKRGEIIDICDYFRLNKNRYILILHRHSLVVYDTNHHTTMVLVKQNVCHHVMLVN